MECRQPSVRRGRAGPGRLWQQTRRTAVAPRERHEGVGGQVRRWAELGASAGGRWAGRPGAARRTSARDSHRARRRVAAAAQPERRAQWPRSRLELSSPRRRMGGRAPRRGPHRRRWPWAPKPWSWTRRGGLPRLHLRPTRAVRPPGDGCARGPHDGAPPRAPARPPGPTGPRRAERARRRSERAGSGAHRQSSRGVCLLHARPGTLEATPRPRPNDKRE